MDKAIINWLPSYLWQSIGRKEKASTLMPIHFMVCLVDHFEPFHGGADLERAQSRVNAWSSKFPKMASRFTDSDGKTPQHSWFYPPHHNQCFLGDLVELCKKGYGEIEMHLHHNRMQPFPDTSETLRAKIYKCIESYSQYGIFCLPDGNKRFAFVHGDWSLDNSGGDGICGVNNEIIVLKECGCFADFTFPSLGKAQPRMINKIYYTKDDPNHAKSYNRGKEIRVGGKPWGDLLIIPGIIGLRWKSRTRKFRPSIEASNVSSSDFPSPERIDYWLEHAVRIKGMPNWKFVKLHTHGAKEENWDSLFGETAEKMYQHLDRKYNDGRQYKLHYVTAREMYNIIKAAEAKKNGNPNHYRDFIIPKYVYR